MYMRPAVQAAPVQRIAQTTRFAAPIGGWIANINLSTPSNGPPGASLLENILPTATGAQIRRGSDVYATLGAGDADVTAMFTYNFGNNKKFFASNETTVYDITTVPTPINYQLADQDGDNLITDLGFYIGQLSTNGLEVIEGMTGGNWIDEQFATSGGNYLVIVNGEDPMQVYDGTDWYSITNEPVNRLDYDAETAPFTVGQTLTGGTSGATAIITRVVDEGADGYLVLGAITGGPFQDNEAITDGAGGSATANGADFVLFGAITGTLPDGSTPLQTSDFSYVWAYKQRLYFVLKESLDIYYMPVDSITGLAKIFRLGAEFNEGGKILFGATWALSYGDGLRDNCIFVSDEGEVIAYAGLSPDDTASWSKVGRYKTGKPRGPRAFIRAGGDIVNATDIGFVPLSQALQTDFSVLSATAVSYPIETAWNEAVALRSSERWDCIVWPDKQMVVVSLPTVNEQPPMMLVSNARTGAWAAFTGWSGTCLEIFNGRLFFGSQDGKIVEANVTGLDQGAPYTAAWVPLFTDFGNSGTQKIGGLSRLQSRGPYEVDAIITTQEDYIVNLPAPPAASPVPFGSEWGVGIWGTSTWGTAQTKTWQGDWQSAGGIGYALAPGVQITSGAIQPLDTEIISLDFSFDMGDWGN